MPLAHHSAIRDVLLIDDDRDDFFIFEEAVKQVDSTVDVRFLSTFDEAQAIANCRVPDLLFLDINMPDRNGFEWLNLIREKGYPFPVVMYSTANNPESVQRAYAEGANLYLPKPETYNTLRDSLRQILNFNWMDPGQVTACFLQHGRYAAFQL